MAVWLDDAMENPLDALETMASGQLLALLEVVKAAERLHTCQEQDVAYRENQLGRVLARLKEFD